MSFLDSLLISVFGLGIVFVVLIALSAVVTVQSKFFSLFKGSNKTSPEKADTSVPGAEPVVDAGTAGELKLMGVDERTAALIMAIVSDESKIPLSELQFKSIKAVD